MIDAVHRQLPVVIDLHCHSTASDGRLTPQALVERAAQDGVRTLALTDHDTLDGLPQALAAARSLGLQFVNGVELSVSWQGRTLHVVGLAFDAENAALANGIAGLQTAREIRAEKIGRRLQRLGVADAYRRARALAGDGQITRPHFARLLVEDGLCRDTAAAFQRYLRPGKPGHASIQWAAIEQAIEWVQQATGIAVLAHPFGYGFSGAWRRRAVAAFAAAGGDALEISTGTTDLIQERQAAADARAHGLAGSIGSDFHAPEQHWLRLGRLRALPADLTPVWQLPAWPG